MYDIIAFAHLYKPHLGGLEKYVENFYKHLPNKKVLVVTSKYFKDLPTEEKDGILDIFRLDCIEIVKGKYFVPTFKGLIQIINTMKESLPNRPEIHTHTKFYFLNYIASLLSHRYRLHHFHFEHGSSPVKDGSRLIRIFAYIVDHTFSKYVVRNSEYVFPISKSIREFVEKSFQQVQFGPTLYNSYNFPQKEFMNKKRPKIVKLLFVGRVIRSKGVYELIDACNKLNKQKFGYKLTIVGDGSEMEEIKNLIRQNRLQKNVILKGALPYEKTQLEYPLHDVFINPSYTEGLPTTVLEALGNNLFVIATDVGGTREILPKDKLIPFENLSGEELMKRIVKIHDNWDNEYSYYHQIYNNVRETFSWERNSKKFLDFTSKFTKE